MWTKYEFNWLIFKMKTHSSINLKLHLLMHAMSTRVDRLFTIVLECLIKSEFVRIADREKLNVKYQKLHIDWHFIWHSIVWNEIRKTFNSNFVVAKECEYIVFADFFLSTLFAQLSDVTILYKLFDCLRRRYFFVYLISQVEMNFSNSIG